MKEKDLKIYWYSNGKWNKYDIENIKDLFSSEPDWTKIEDIKDYGQNKIKVTYKNGKEIYYENIHGTYGQPVRIR